MYLDDLIMCKLIGSIGEAAKIIDGDREVLTSLYHILYLSSYLGWHDCDLVCERSTIIKTSMPLNIIFHNTGSIIGPLLPRIS